MKTFVGHQRRDEKQKGKDNPKSKKNWEKNFLHNFRHIPHRWWSCGGTQGLESRRARGSSLVGQCLYGNRVWSNGSKKHGKNNTRTRQTSSSVMISRLKRERKPLWKDFSSSSDQNQPRPIPSFQEAPRKAFPRAALFWSADRYLAKTDCKWETFEKEDRQSFENICCWLTIGSGEEGLASEHLRHDAANRPSSGILQMKGPWRGCNTSSWVWSQIQTRGRQCGCSASSWAWSQERDTSESPRSLSSRSPLAWYGYYDFDVMMTIYWTLWILFYLEVLLFQNHENSPWSLITALMTCQSVFW